MLNEKNIKFNIPVGDAEIITLKKNVKFRGFLISEEHMIIKYKDVPHLIITDIHEDILKGFFIGEKSLKKIHKNLSSIIEDDYLIQLLITIADYANATGNFSKGIEKMQKIYNQHIA